MYYCFTAMGFLLLEGLAYGFILHLWCESSDFWLVGLWTTGPYRVPDRCLLQFNNSGITYYNIY